MKTLCEAFQVAHGSWKDFDPSLCYGLDRTNELYSQHATPDDMIQFGYISQEEFERYFKFAFVRNPFDRLYSEYNYLNQASTRLGIPFKETYPTYKDFLRDIEQTFITSGDIHP